MVFPFSQQEIVYVEYMLGQYTSSVEDFVPVPN